MNVSKTITRTTAKLLLMTFVSIICFIPITQAAMIGTQQMMNNEQAQQDRAQLTSMLQRTDLVAQLEQAGVNPQQLQARVSTLTDQEVATLTEQLDQLPAGSGLIMTGLLVFVILIGTDIAGYTDIFPFVDEMDMDRDRNRRR